MEGRIVKDAFGWGMGLWLFGYVLGIVLYMLMPQQLIGLTITPVGVVVSSWVLMKKMSSRLFGYYLVVGIVWVVIAVVFDYFLLVKLFKPVDYYKWDVYVYYLSALVLPWGVGLYKNYYHKK